MSASPKKSKQPAVRSIQRALHVIVELNSKGEASAAELARAVLLPRPTVYRILETLVAGGYVRRTENNQRYRPDALTAGLSIGYAGEDWLHRFAIGPMRDVESETGCQIAVATLSGLAMIIRVLTVDDTDTGILRLDSREPLLTSASGMLCLAYSKPGQRDILLRKLAWSEDPLDAQARNASAVRRVIDLVAGRGYAVSYRSADSEYSSVLAVPIQPDGRFIAALVLRAGDRRFTHDQIVHEYLSTLQKAADRVREGFERRIEDLEGAIHLLRPTSRA